MGATGSRRQPPNLTKTHKSDRYRTGRIPPFILTFNSLRTLQNHKSDRPTNTRPMCLMSLQSKPPFDFFSMFRGKQASVPSVAFPLCEICAMRGRRSACGQNPGLDRARAQPILTQYGLLRLVTVKKILKSHPPPHFIKFERIVSAPCGGTARLRASPKPEGNEVDSGKDGCHAGRS